MMTTLPLATMLAMLSSSIALAGGETKSIPQDLLIEWTNVGREPEAAADVTVFTDGRVRLSDRFGGGQRRLSETETDALRRFVFEEQKILDIDSAALEREVRTVAERRKAATDSAAVEMVITPPRDAGTTVVRVNDQGRRHEVSYYNLAGDAEAYPEIEALQRLRRIELRLLEITVRP